MLRNLSRSTCQVLSGCCLLALTAFTARAQTLTFTTLAGTAGGSGSADGTGSAARFNSPWGVATDSGGNVYVADTRNHTIRKISPAAVVTTLAGLAGVSGSADGVGAAALFKFPSGVATDSRGNVYVADMYNHTVRKITPARVVTTLAGWAGIPGSADGTGSAARFNLPSGLATDSGGNVYVPDTGNHTIRKITPAGVVTTLAGLPGEDGGVDGTGSAARFKNPQGLATDRGGNVYVADSGNNTIRKITPAGVVTTLAGTAGQAGFSAGLLTHPAAVAVDSGGNLFVADFWRMRKITPAGTVSTVADARVGNAAYFTFDAGVAIDNAGNLYVADAKNSTIRKITPAGAMTTLAGTADSAQSKDGTGNAARFSKPAGVATDSAGNVYVADTHNHTIRKITMAGVVTTLAGSADSDENADGTGSAASFRAPKGIATDSGGNVYVTDASNPAIRKITPVGVVTTIAGAVRAAHTDPENGSADGTGSAARFKNPQGLATDGGGNVYVADSGNNTIRKITPAGVVTTLAGTAGEGGSADGTGSAARFDNPQGLATDGSGNVYVTDTGNITIRKITPAGAVTTLAGTAGEGGSADGTGSAARLTNLTGVATDRGGNVYVAEGGNHTIRKITPAGVVTTVGGSPGLKGSTDGVGSAARFNAPSAVAIDSAGNVYVADTNNNEIRIGKPTLADAATIDASAGAVGAKRQLDTTPQTATSWHWRIVRQPSGSAAKLSSTSIRNPLFIPDVADLYTFQLTASNGVNISITTVSLTATASASPRAAR